MFEVMKQQINWNKYNFTEVELREAVKTSTSLRATLLKLGLQGKGGGYKPTKRIIELLEIDTSHWLGCGHLKGKTHSYTPPKPLEELLINGSSIQSNTLKKRLLKAQLLENKCARCTTSEWQGEKLSLHLDHINGVNNDNRLENLRLLCPNCHSLTPTYCGKNKKLNNVKNDYQYVGKRVILSKQCIDCNAYIRKESIRCKPCRNQTLKVSKILWPPKDELVTRINNSSYTKVAKDLCVSRTLLRKYIRS